MIQIANPVYDVVFKYMMEDQEIAKAFLGAFLKKEVVEVKLQRNEYAGTLAADTAAAGTRKSKKNFPASWKDTEVMQAREAARQTMEKAKAEAEAKTALSIRLLSKHGMMAEQIAGALGIPLEQVIKTMEN